MAKKKKEQMNSGQAEIRTPFREFVKSFKKQKNALVAAVFLICLALIAIIIPFCKVHP